MRPCAKDDKAERQEAAHGALGLPASRLLVP